MSRSAKKKYIYPLIIITLLLVGSLSGIGILVNQINTYQNKYQTQLTNLQQSSDRVAALNIQINDLQEANNNMTANISKQTIDNNNLISTNTNLTNTITILNTTIDNSNILIENLI